jgi:hypothetical protein
VICEGAPGGHTAGAAGCGVRWRPMMTKGHEGMVRCSSRFMFLGLALLGCGGGKPPASQAAPATEAAPASSWEPSPLPTDGAIGMLGLTGPEKPWETMNYEEKEWYMVGKVHPVMRQVFQSLDAQKYEGEKFECAPCHGDNAAERKYKMPNPQLSAVPQYGSPSWKQMENAKIVKFMYQRVTPSTAALLGKKSFDPSTGEGFNCWGCHPHE